MRTKYRPKHSDATKMSPRVKQFLADAVECNRFDRKLTGDPYRARHSVDVGLELVRA